MVVPGAVLVDPGLARPVDRDVFGCRIFKPRLKRSHQVFEQRGGGRQGHLTTLRGGAGHSDVFKS